MFSSFLKKWRSSGKNAHGILGAGVRCEWVVEILKFDLEAGILE
jgi:hypothetical protein